MRGPWKGCARQVSEEIRTKERWTDRYAKKGTRERGRWTDVHKERDKGLRR